MIRQRPEKNLTHPPGQVHFERPLTTAIEEYRQEGHQKALREAYERGYEAGYQTGLTKAVLTSGASDPYGEAGR